VRAAVEGRGLINALRVEPELGSPHRGGLPETIARRTANGWRILRPEGLLHRRLGAAMVRGIARTDDTEPRTGYVLVPADADGIRIERNVGSSRDAGDRQPRRRVRRHRRPSEPCARSARARSMAKRAGDPVGVDAALLSAIYLGVADAARDWLVGFPAQPRTHRPRSALATLERMQLAVGEIDALREGAAIILAAMAEKG